MLGRVQRTEHGLVIRVTEEMAASLVLAEGTEVDILPVPREAFTQYATAQDAFAAFERTLPEHEAAYRELASTTSCAWTKIQGRSASRPAASRAVALPAPTPFGDGGFGAVA